MSAWRARIGLGVLAAAAAWAFGSGQAAAPAAARCLPPEPSAAAERATVAALASPRDVWGERALAARGGPSAAAVGGLLAPLFDARAAKRRQLTSSGAYYLPFAEPVGALGFGLVALHLADGSEIVSQKIGGPSLTIAVGADGKERYGSCLAKLQTPSLAAGYLPVLETAYRDGAGASYREESFAASVPGLPGLISFVRLRAAARAARGAIELRFTLSTGGLEALPGRLVADGATELGFSPGGRLQGSSLVYRLAAGHVRTVYLAYFDHPGPTAALPPLAGLYGAARRSLVAYWSAQLARGASISVPEREVDDAERALLIQNLELAYRYSAGNSYEEFSLPESIDVARVMGEWGFGGVERAIVRLSFTRRPTPYPNWTRGEKLVAVAEDYELFRDRGFVRAATPVLGGYLATIGSELGRDGLLPREQYSSDITLQVYGLPAQTVVWQGLEAIARVWAQTGEAALGARAHALARRLHAGLERAVVASARWLPDGSLFVPVMLLSGERPYASLTATRLGSYWNLVMPYALASGFFPPGSREADGILDYLRLHGALFVGLVRAGAYALYGRHAPAPVSGTDEVYGINLARFLADNDQAGELVLSLYAQLADAMTPGTFVSGEAASVAPLAGTSERAMYLPPNSAANASFLETLRLMLVHELDGPGGQPLGLELAYATPRSWLLPGRTVRVRDLPTSFGPLSYTLAAGARRIDAVVVVPVRRPGSLRLRLRLPLGERIASVTVDGAPERRLSRASGTIDLSGLRGRLQLVVRLA